MKAPESEQPSQDDIMAIIKLVHFWFVLSLTPLN